MNPESIKTNVANLPPSPVKPLGPILLTPRGFETIHFPDLCDVKCSVQQSSTIIDEVPGAMDNPGSSALWIGVSEDRVQVMARDASKVGVQTSKTTGWVPYPIPEEVMITKRMHLSREQVRSLVPVLERWLETGMLSEQKPE